MRKKTLFLDPSKPIATCTQSSCEGCPLLDTLHCHFSGKDLAKFIAAVLPSFAIGGIGVYRLGVWFFIPWILFILSYFELIEIRVMCSHCPHYAEAGKRLKCWANYGSPKLWRYRPGPMSWMEKAIFLAGLILVFGYPLALFLVAAKWSPAALYGVAVVGAYLFMRKAMCSRCMNFACPLNLVDEARRKEFLKRNPPLLRVPPTA
ncbi:MAG: hypothetical protein D6759_08005 [Chloroflexi bacterium]|nr:MAG: hypothetical protein D6759_08005 [Chloroflexota bacterium]